MRILKAKPTRFHRSEARLRLLDRLFLRDDKDPGFSNRRMFEEDFARIFNYHNRNGGDLFVVNSNDEDLTKRLLSGIEGRYGYNSVDKTVREWVEKTAQSLVWFGTAYFFLRDAEQGDIHIEPLSSSGIIHMFGTYIQWVPSLVKKHWDREDEEISREIRVLNSSKLMRLVMPRSLKRMLSTQNRTLATLDKHQYSLADFQPRPTHENPNPTNYFDFGTWKDTQDRALYRSTRFTGWNGRKHDASKRSDFFDCYRLIRFRRNQLMLRDDILSQISSELSRVGKGYNATFFIEISGTAKLPSVADLNELERRLTREDAGFTEILDYCLKR